MRPRKLPLPTSDDLVDIAKVTLSQASLCLLKRRVVSLDVTHCSD